MIFVTGDTHGTDFYRMRSPFGKELTKDDYVVVLGDFGVLWDNSKEGQFWLNWLTEKPWTTLFIDGNHENFGMLKALPTELKFRNDVGKVNDSIYHLRRGRIYTIDGHNILCMGGAYSQDKAMRREGTSWWPEESISEDDLLMAKEELGMVNGYVDYVFTHTCPHRLLPQFGILNPNDSSSFSLSLMEVNLKGFKHWYFGHMHQNKTIFMPYLEPRFTSLYDKMVVLGDWLKEEEQDDFHTTKVIG